MRIHRAGYFIIAIALGIFTILLIAAVIAVPSPWFWLLVASLVVGLLFVVQFFRHPRRIVPMLDDQLVYAPADGKVVVIEAVEESEYFKGKRLQVSIFMSPLNVHVNRNPLSGKVQYKKYHPGKYLVAWHPKSSTENERMTVVLNNGKTDVLIRQIAGAMARRIINYLEVGQQVKQGADMGFIRFGSRVDIFLPLDAKIETKVGQKVRGNLDLIARL